MKKEVEDYCNEGVQRQGDIRKIIEERIKADASMRLKMPPNDDIVPNNIVLFAAGLLSAYKFYCKRYPHYTPIVEKYCNETDHLLGL